MAVYLVTVGTSILENYCEENDCKNIQGENDGWKEKEVENIKEKIIEWLKKNDKRCCAEIATLLKVKDKTGKREVYLFHTKEIGEIAAKILRDFLEETQGADVYLVKVDGKNLESIWSKIFEVHMNNKDEDLVAISSGGFKTMSAVMMTYAIVNDIKAYYMHESDEEPTILNALPVEWDAQRLFMYAASRERGNLLRGIREDLLRFKEDISYKEPAIRLLKDGNWKDYLSKRIRIWSNLWIGDLIPETVEHSRNHTRRILDRFLNIYNELELEYINPNLFLAFFISAAYLHDIGHTVMSVSNDEKTLVLSHFPEAIRAIHNVLSAYEILKKRDFLIGPVPDDDRFVEALALVVLYHRKKWKFDDYFSVSEFESAVLRAFLKPLFESDIKLEPPNSFLENLSKIYEKDSEEYKAAAAAEVMLKFLDELDVQADRIVDESYMRVRLERTIDEVNVILETNEVYHKEEIVSIRDALKEKLKDEKFVRGEEELDESLKHEISNLKEDVYSKMYGHLMEILNGESVDQQLSATVKVIFKLDQFGHFAKHRKVVAVIPEIDDGHVKIRVISAEAKEVLRKDINEQIEDVGDYFNDYFGVEISKIRG